MTMLPLEPRDIPLDGRDPQVWAAWCERWEALADRLFRAMTVEADTRLGVRLRELMARAIAEAGGVSVDAAYDHLAAELSHTDPVLHLELEYAATKARVMAAAQLGDPYGEEQATGDPLDILNRTLGLTPRRTDEEG